METNPKPLVNLEPIVYHIITSCHPKLKKKWLNTYPTSGHSPEFYRASLDFLLTFIQKWSIAPQDTPYILSLLQKCMKSLHGNLQAHWEQALETLSTIVRRQGLYSSFLYGDVSEERDHLLFEILRCFPKEVLGHSLNSTKDHVIFHTLCKFLAHENELKTHADNVLTRLREEFLVDKSKLNVRMTPYISRNLMDDYAFEDFLSTALKLTKRSEANLETLIVFLENNTFDMSKRAYSLLFEDLKDLITAKEKEKVEKFRRAYKAVLTQIRDPLVQDKIFRELIKLVHENNQEYIKVSLLQLMFWTVKAGNQECCQQWVKALLGTVSSSASFVTGDESAPIVLEEIRNLREFLRKKETPIVVGIEEKEYVNLRKQVANANLNKNALNIISAVFVCLLDFEREDASIMKELGGLIETAYNNQVAANVKAIIKLVTSYPGTIGVLLNASIYLQHTENAKLEKAVKSDLVAMLDENSFVNMQKFFNKVNYEELSNWLRVIGINAPRFAGALSFSDNKFTIFCSTLTETLTHPLMSTKDITEFLNQLQEKDFMYYAIVHGLFSKLHIATEGELERMRFDKAWLALHHIIKDLDSIDLTNELVLELFWLINCERINPNLKLRSQLEILIGKQKDLKDKLMGVVNDMYDGFKSFLLSKDGVLAQNLHKSETAVNMYSMLISWGLYEFLSELKPFINQENYSDATEIDKFEEDSKNPDFESDISAYNNTLFKIGITEAKPQQEESKTSDGAKGGKGKTGKGPAKAPGGGNKKGGKDTDQPKKQMHLEDIIRLQQEELSRKMGIYIKVVGRILKKVLRLRKPEVTREYFERCHENLKELAQDEIACGTVEEVLYVLLRFAPYRSIARSCDYMIRAYYCRLSGLRLRSQEITESFINHIRNLKELGAAKIDSHYANIVYETCQFILVSENLDPQIKSQSLSVIIKIGTTSESNELGSEILQMMIDYLDSISYYPETQNLFIFLMERFADKVLDPLFSYILDYVDYAKILCLRALLAIDRPDIFKDFERYLKIMILALDEHETILDLSKQLMEKYKLAIVPAHIEGFNLKDFVNIESNDSVEKFCRLTPDLIREAPTAAHTLIQKSIDAAQHLANNKEIKRMEDALFFLPELVQNNIPHVKTFLPKIFDIFVDQYCVEIYPSLMKKTLEVGREIIEVYGNEEVDFILGFLEKYMDKKYAAQTNVTAVALLGACAPYVKDKSKVKSICSKILMTANSHSEYLKKNVARALPDLIDLFENPYAIAQDLLESLQVEKDLEKAKGSAYILSGFIKGLGVGLINVIGIFEFLEQTGERKKASPIIKHSILAVIQALIENLGKTFEPFFPRMLQVLMTFYGEQQEEIRLASLKCTKSMMTYLSAFGVRQIVPYLLKGIEEKTWRAKVASISVLGNMAFCAPKQLSTCLPQIVPKLAQALADPHPAVQEKGNIALQEIGSTIKSPEISDVAEILVKALSNPYDENKKGLQALLHAQFVHYIDPPSLSLIMPIIEYGLRNRDSTLKMNAAQVIGGICNLIKSPADLDPYLPSLISALKVAVCDTIGDVRALAAKACGSLSQNIGFEKSGPMIKMVQEILESGETTSIERAGAAQAISEITFALGKSYIDMALPVYLTNTTSEQIHIKESYIGVFAFLPGIMEEEFEPYIADVVDSIVDTISSSNETIRSLTVRVCRILIQRFGLKQTSTLMDPVEVGLFSPNWRKRNSSIVLVGEMLELLQEQKGDKKGLAKELEEKYSGRYNNMVTSVHILKFDSMEDIKNIANQTWKNYVSNTPKTLKLIFPLLLDKLIFIISEVEEITEMATTCMREFGAKYSEAMLANILTHFEKKKVDHKADLQHMKALCILMDILISSMAYDFIEARKDDLLPSVLDLLLVSNDFNKPDAAQVLQTLIRKCKHSNSIEISGLSEGIKLVVENTKSKDFLLNYFFAKCITADMNTSETLYLSTIYKIVKADRNGFPKQLLEEICEKMQEDKGLQGEGDHVKYIGRIFGLLVSTEETDKQKDIMSLLLGKLEGVSDEEYLIFERFMGALIFCHPKVIEEMGVGGLEKRISETMKKIQARDNVINALQNVGKLKKSGEKVKAELGKCILQNNNFKELYKNSEIEQDVVANILQAL